MLVVSILSNATRNRVFSITKSTGMHSQGSILGNHSLDSVAAEVKTLPHLENREVQPVPGFTGRAHVSEVEANTEKKRRPSKCMPSGDPKSLYF